VKVGFWQFWRIVTDTNRDLPFNDYVDNALTALPFFYPVGDSQRMAHGDQKKYFVSKSTLIMATVNTHVTFNNTNNVEDFLLAGVWYEFKSNIFSVNVVDAAQPGEDDAIYMYFEGVMTDEARRPE